MKYTLFIHAQHIDETRRNKPSLPHQSVCWQFLQTQCVTQLSLSRSFTKYWYDRTHQELYKFGIKVSKRFSTDFHVRQ